MKKLLIAFVGVLLVGCGTPPPPTVGIRDGGPAAPKCAESEAQAASSPNVVVNGAWDCLATAMQQSFQDQVHITGDQGLAHYAGVSPAFSHYYSCGERNGDGWWYFDLRHNVSPTPIDANMHYAVRMMIDAKGKVVQFQFAPGYADINTC